MFLSFRISEVLALTIGHVLHHGELRRRAALPPRFLKGKTATHAACRSDPKCTVRSSATSRSAQENTCSCRPEPLFRSRFHAADGGPKPITRSMAEKISKRAFRMTSGDTLRASSHSLSSSQWRHRNRPNLRASTALRMAAQNRSGELVAPRQNIASPIVDGMVGRHLKYWRSGVLLPRGLLTIGVYKNHHTAGHLALIALSSAMFAMFTLHAVQRTLDPLSQPISFYVHGDHGWLLTFALYCFGAAAVAVAFAGREGQEKRETSYSLVVFGAGMVLAGIVPSDRWFPWEAPPSASGIIHATAAVFSPPVLLISMFNHMQRDRRRWRRIKVLCIATYFTGLITSACALAIGFLLDSPPPLIGLSERVLALGSASWLAVAASACR